MKRTLEDLTPRERQLVTEYLPELTQLDAARLEAFGLMSDGRALELLEQLATDPVVAMALGTDLLVEMTRDMIKVLRHYDDAQVERALAVLRGAS